MTAEWENARCMHGNLAHVCLALYCRNPQLAKSDDLRELQEQNRAGCHHPRVQGAISNARAEVESRDRILLGRFDLAFCPDCHRDVAVERPPAVALGA